MMSKSPQGILVLAENEGRRAVAIQTPHSLFTLTGKIGGTSSALYAKRKGSRPATAIGGTWSQSVAQDYDLVGWARQTVRTDAKSEAVEAEWLPKDAFQPTAYLHAGDLVQIAGKRVLIRFDPFGGNFEEQAERQEALDRFLQRRKLSNLSPTVIWFGKVGPETRLDRVEVLLLDPKDGLRRALKAETWALIDRSGRLRTTGSAEVLAERIAAVGHSD